MPACDDKCIGHWKYSHTFSGNSRSNLVDSRKTFSTCIVRCNPSSTETPSSSEEGDRITEGTYFGWCEEEGCDTGASSPFILRQKVSPSRRRQAIVDGCADLRLTESNKLKFTLVDCNDKRKPLLFRYLMADKIITPPPNRN